MRASAESPTGRPLTAYLCSDEKGFTIAVRAQSSDNQFKVNLVHYHVFAQESEATSVEASEGPLPRAARRETGDGSFIP